MLSSLKLQPRYISTKVDVGKTFYDSVLSEAVSYDRFSAYFSAKALSRYAQGLQKFGLNKGHYRLIVSNYVDEAAFHDIQKAYEIRERYDKEALLPRLIEDLSIDEQMCFSNLAYLVASGVAEIKIAYKCDGMFHDKLSLFRDSEGNVVYTHGSNNETEASIAKNYESFDVSVSWDGSEMEAGKIADAINEFEAFWNNDVDGFAVLPASKVIVDGISRYSQGHMITDSAYLHEDAVVLDYRNRGLVYVGVDMDRFVKSSVYRMYPMSLMVDFHDNRFIYLRETCTYMDFQKLEEALCHGAEKYGYSFYITQDMKDFIMKSDILIQQRFKMGLDIRTHSLNIIDKFNEYSKIVNSEMVRPLRERQMWDSFFMYSMKSSADFSVPGAGKTAAVLGVFACLYKQGKVRRLVVIGPKSSFISWKDEFSACFGSRIPLSCFDISKAKGDKAKALRYDTLHDNLFLLNYECFQSNLLLREAVKELADKDTVLVFDEAHRIKAINGKMAENALEIARNRTDRYTVVLTGTPVPNSYCDIYNMLHLLYPQEYDLFFGFSPSQLANANNRIIDIINEKLQPFFCRTTKDELGVPKADPDVLVECDASDYENDAFHIISTRYREQPLALMVRLLQLESCPELLLEKINSSEFSDILEIDEEDDDVEIVDYSEEFRNLVMTIENTAKFKVFMAQAEALLKDGRPAVVWCLFIRSINKIVSSLEQIGARVVKIVGNMDGVVKESLIKAFQKGEYDFLVTNPQTLAESVSLHRNCHDAIYFEYSFNLAHMLQSRDRIHRLGLPDDARTRYTYLVENFTKRNGDEYSMDRAIYERLEEKKHIMLEAIENHVLEPGYTTADDLDAIFSSL